MNNYEKSVPFFAARSSVLIPYFSILVCRFSAVCHYSISPHNTRSSATYSRRMLIGTEGEPFDSPDYIYELKIDGERCVAYLDPQVGTDLRNKRNHKMLPKVPELAALHEMCAAAASWTASWQ